MRRSPSARSAGTPLQGASRPSPFPIPSSPILSPFSQSPFLLFQAPIPTHLAVLGHELEGLDESNGLVDITADREVIHRDLLQHPLRIDEEQAPQGYPNVLQEYAVVRGDGLCHVGDQGDLHVTQASSLAGRAHPRQVRFFRVGRDADHLGADIFKAMGSI